MFRRYFLPLLASMAFVFAASVVVSAQNGQLRGHVTLKQADGTVVPAVNAIVDAVTDTIEETPPELVADMMARGITLAGGGSLLPGLADLLSRRTKMQVHLAEDPLGCVVRGTGKVLNELEVLRKVLVDQHSGRPLYRR